jgi:ATP-dependent Clp protease ATP-binding subunit ClpA
VLARVHLYVRPFPDGRVVVTPLRFSQLEADAGSAEAARRLVHDRLREHFGKLSVDDRTALLQPCSTVLERVLVVVPLGGKSGETLALFVGVVVQTFDRDDGPSHAAQAPAAPWERTEGRDRGEVVARLERKLGKMLSKWAPERRAAVEHPPGARLETVTMAVPTTPPPAPAAKPAAAAEKEPTFLESAGRELTAVAASLHGVDHREALVDRVLAALALPERSSVMLVGPPDVGKTAIVHEVARRLAAGRVPPELRGRELWELTANELIAGARYTGMWQQRAVDMMEDARSRGAIVAMGDPGAIVDAGRWSGSDNNLSRLLRTHMERGTLTLVCDCPAEALQAVRLLEPSFVDAFNRVDVPEPPIEEARRILAAAAGRLETGLGVRADETALDAAVELTRRFEPYRGFPGKAVRLLTETVRAAVTAGAAGVGRPDAVRTFTARTGLPIDLLSDEVPLRAGAVAEHFEARVLGQPDAVRAMVDLVMVLKAALNDPAKPLGTFLFVGPTGVGKTEMAKALAELLFGSRDRLLRVDMGEHTGSDAVHRLLGTRWGHDDDEGWLVRRVREQPFCVVLLDEIEKAHWQVFDALLGALGEGRLTDAAGRTADLRSAIIVMTSNLGADGQRSGTLGFASSPEAADEGRRSAEHHLRQVEDFFRPEFVNRIDRVIAFDPLDEDAIRRIARRELGRLLLREGIVRRQLLVEVDDPVVRELAARGFHPRYGARPLQREIERAVISPLARRLVEQRPAPGDLVRVHLRDGEVAVDVRAVEVPEPRPARPAPAARPPDGTLARAADDAAALARLVEREESLPALATVREELSRLVASTSGPDFWDEPAGARRTLARVYELQRLLDGFAALRRRSEGLAELGRQLRQARDRGRLPTLRQAVQEVEGGLELLRLEVAGAALPGQASPALVRVTPIGRGAGAWAGELLAMYVAWAERTGREAQRVPGSRAAVIAGPSSRDLLAPESGLHRRVPPEGDALLARVAVSGPDEEGAPEAEAVVVRIYEDRRRQVRDPRTGVSVRDPAGVLREGRIDPFLIAGIGLREP